MKKKNKNLFYPTIVIGFVLISTCGCSKKDSNDNPVYGDNVTDIDGNVYHTVIIDRTQIWMVENLKTTHYNDGIILIPNETDNTKWTSLTTAAYCWYNNDVNNKATYGALYNWYAASNSKLCPKNWHIPTNAEWMDLITFSGGESTAGKKLKETGTTHWSSPNSGANNSSLYTALPGGSRYGDGKFYDMNTTGYWWSTSEFNTYNAWGGWLAYDKFNVGSFYVSKFIGFSVRCKKD